jgi:hypothetical protein
MAALSKIRAAGGAFIRSEPFVRAPSPPAAHAAAAARPDGGTPRLRAPAAVLAHGTCDRFRLRLEGRQAQIYLHLAASEIAGHPDIFRIRINQASASLLLWVRLGSELEGDGARVLALVSDALRRIALGERSCAAPIETVRDDHLGLGLSLLRAVAL